MKRFHVHLHIDELQASIAFYSRLFSVQPTRIEADYAKWVLDDPRVNFAISTRGNKTGVDHLGFQTETTEELETLKQAAESAELTLTDEGETTCCYARSEKHWIVDPQGIPWEHFHTLGNIAVFNESQQATEDGVCCAPVRGKPVGIPVKSESSCC
jgi:Glyoxalase/Bleomycin resistance protein/Dioxygenase superfamily